MSMDYLYAQLPDLIYNPAEFMGTSSSGTIKIDVNNNTGVINANVLRTPGILRVKNYNSDIVDIEFNGSTDAYIEIPKIPEAIDLEAATVTQDDINKNYFPVGTPIGAPYLKIKVTDDKWVRVLVPTPEIRSKINTVKTFFIYSFENLSQIPNLNNGDSFFAQKHDKILRYTYTNDQFVESEEVLAGNVYAILDTGFLVLATTGSSDNIEFIVLRAEVDRIKASLENDIELLSTAVSKSIDNLTDEITNKHTELSEKLNLTIQDLDGLDATVDELKSEINDEINPSIINLLDSKQDVLSFLGTYNATTNKVATESTVDTAKLNILNEVNDKLDTFKDSLGDVQESLDKISLTDTAITLSEQFTITKDFGYYTLDGAASKKVGTVGQSLHEFLQGAFAEEDKTIFNPEPSCSIDMSGGKYEIGSTVTPSARWSTSAGTYKWGTYSNGTANYNDKTTGITYNTGIITIEPASFVISKDTTVNASGTTTRNRATKYPCSNLGSNLSSTQAFAEYMSEKVLDCTKAVTFTCYREGFFSGTSTSKLAAADINSDKVRGLYKTGTNYTSGKKTFTVPVGAATIIFACPADKSGVTKVYNKTVNADMTTSFTNKSIVSVEGANGNNATNYNIWIFTPSEAYGTAAELEITLG